MKVSRDERDGLFGRMSLRRETARGAGQHLSLTPYTFPLIGVDLSFARVARSHPSLPCDLAETFEGTLSTHGSPSAAMSTSSLKLIIAIDQLASAPPR